MTGWVTIQEIRWLEAELDNLGFKVVQPHLGSERDAVSVVPKDSDSLPMYSRDAKIYTGSIEGLRYWIQGLTWARQYDMMLKLSDDKKRDRKEHEERNRQLIRRLRDEELGLKT
jgi:hypothetical protein